MSETCELSLVEFFSATVAEFQEEDDQDYEAHKVPGAGLPIKEPAPHLIDQLIDENREMWEKFLNNRFALDGATLPAQEFDQKYRMYAEQNYHYLLEYAAFKAYRSLHRVRNHRTESEIEAVANTMHRDLKFVRDFRAALSKKGITVTEDQDLAHGLIAYTTWQQHKAMTVDPFSALVLMIPCIYGWHQIALRLQEQEKAGKIEIKKDTLFYKLWYVPNLDSSHANRMRERITNRRARYESQLLRQRWSELFRIGCQMELALFHSPYVDF